MGDYEIASPQLEHAVTRQPIGKDAGEDEAVAIFALGCFWGAEKAFWKLPGVVTTAVGYIAGEVEHPTYRAVCSGMTGHTEAVRVVFRTKELSYDDLLAVFWESHDPTQGNRQGNDIGTQYRSGIYTADQRQEEAAQLSKKRYEAALLEAPLSKAGGRKITTEIRPATTFWFAEEYHQQYLHKNPGGYCGLGGCGVKYPG